MASELDFLPDQPEDLSFLPNKPKQNRSIKDFLSAKTTDGESVPWKTLKNIGKGFAKKADSFVATKEELIQRLKDAKEQMQKDPSNFAEESALNFSPSALGMGTIGGKLAKGFTQAVKEGQVFKGLEGAGKFEISDLLAKLKQLPKALQSLKLSEVIEHPELFKNYPELQNLEVTRTIPRPGMDAGLRGQYIGAEAGSAPQIRLNYQQNTPKEEITSSLMHELQHGIQEKEGFAGGGSMSQFDFPSTPKNTDITDTIRTIRDIQELLTTTTNPEVRKELLNELSKHEQNLEILGNDVINQEFLTPYEQYRRLSGETEARNVQKRLRFTPEQRMETPFTSTYDVPIEQQRLK